MPTADGSPLSVVSAGGRQMRCCILMAWAPGRPLVDVPVDRLLPHGLRSVGAYLARTHSVSEGFSVPEGFLRPERGFFAHVYGSSALLWQRGAVVYSTAQMDVFRRAASRICSELASLGNGRDVFGMIHADPHLNNLLVSDDAIGPEGVCAVDFDGTGWGHYLYDLAVTLLSLESWLNERPDIRAAAREALLEGYFSERPPSGVHRDRLAVFKALRLVELASRVLSWDRPERQWWGPPLLAEAPVRLARFLDEGDIGDIGETPGTTP